MRKTQNTYTIGLMSGTSLDGVDLVYVRLGFGNDFEILQAETIPYPNFWIKNLKNIAALEKGAEELLWLDKELGAYLGKLLKNFIDKYEIASLDFIASHGHTVHHQPEQGYTLQIGCGKQIYKATKIKTVYDFRTQDVLLGGQGAPLVPVGDEMLFSEYDYCLNLGGFSNVSYQKNGERFAFDICPVNTVLNRYAVKLGFLYDDGGGLAKSGKIDKQLLLTLNKLSFYKDSFPKSLGVEFLESDVLPLLARSGLSEVDVLRTFIEHIAYQLAQKITGGTVLITGGGAYNLFLLERFKALSNDVSIILLDNKITDYKEALIFALLGRLKIENKTNCLSSVTGASANHSSGVVVGL